MKTREEEIEIAALNLFEQVRISNLLSFEEGAKWSDKHPKNPWISVEDRLPKALTKVFVRRQDDFYLLAELNGNKWFAYGFGWQDKKGFEITHWMPIPELKKE